jgi:peptidoglycan/LPS O-acetylase OafA/YrhL
MDRVETVPVIAAPTRVDRSHQTDDAPTIAVYYPYFDYLRIALAIVVMLSHDNLIQWLYAGDLAVQVFFGLSGWLIGGALLKLSRRDLPRFYFNRALRIWIPYYVALALLIAASLLHDPINGKWAELIFYKLSFVHNLFGASQSIEQMPLQGTGRYFWSVNAEEQFYLIAPIVLVLLAAKWGRTIGFWLGLAMVAWIANIYSSIVFGVLAAIVVRQYGPIHQQPIVRHLLASMAIVTMIAMTAGFSYPLLSPLFALSVVLWLAIPGRAHSIGTVLGGMSYPLYLNHWIGVFISHLALKPWHLKATPLQPILAIGLNLVIAALLYWLVDRRIITLRKRLFTPQRGTIAIFIAYGMMLIGLIGGLVMTRAG